MKNMKKFMAVMAVASLVATSTITVSAFEYEGPAGDTTDAEASANGHTTFSVIEAVEGSNPNNVSFTVPLYVTMAVVGKEAELYTPSNYEIKNTSQAQENGDAAYGLAVTGMTFEKLEGSSYNTVEKFITAADVLVDADLVASTNKDMILSIGGQYMPALSTPSSIAVKLTELRKDGEDEDIPTSFYNGAKYTTTAAGGVLPLSIKATLALPASDSLENAAAVPQFKVKYTVTAVIGDEDDEFLLTVYAGDDSVAAGLGVYDVTTGKFPVQVTPDESAE